MYKKAKIAVVTLGHYIYFEQFESLETELRKKTAELIDYIDASKCEIFDAGFVDTPEKSFVAVQELKKADVDLLFVLLSTYVPSSVCMPFARYIDVPHILIGIQPLDHLDYANTTTFMQLVNDDICAMPEIAGVYNRLGRAIPKCIVASSSQREYIRKEIGEWVDAANAKAAFKYSTIGYLGHTYEGMYDMHTDPTAFARTFGSHIKMLEMCELVKLVDEVNAKELSNKISKIKEIFEICEPSHDPITDYVQDCDMEIAAKVACALDKLVERNNLTALAYYYKGEKNRYEEIGANLIIGNTLLTSAGIPLAGEADLKTAAAMLIMNRIGAGGSFAEIHPFDTESDIVLIGHDGPHNIEIASRKPYLRKLKKYHGKSGSGIGVEFSIKSGDLTMLGITLDADGQFRMVAAKGVSIAGEIPQTGNTNTKVSFNCPINQFLERWCEAGPTHHIALGCGDKIETIKKFSILSGIRLTIIS